RVRHVVPVVAIFVPGTVAADEAGLPVEKGLLNAVPGDRTRLFQHPRIASEEGHACQMHGATDGVGGPTGTFYAPELVPERRGAEWGDKCAGGPGLIP